MAENNCSLFAFWVYTNDDNFHNIQPDYEPKSFWKKDYKYSWSVICCELGRIPIVFITIGRVCLTPFKIWKLKSLCFDNVSITNAPLESRPTRRLCKKGELIGTDLGLGIWLFNLLFLQSVSYTIVQ